MTKLAYPSKGVYPQCEKNFLSYHEDLSEAAKLCNFDDNNVPNDFPAKQYLTSLKGYLIKVGFACVDVMREVKGADAAYQSFSDEALADAAKITVTKVSKNDRLVRADSSAGAQSGFGQSGAAAGGAAGGAAGAIANSAASAKKAKADKKKILADELHKEKLDAIATKKKINMNKIKNDLNARASFVLSKELKTKLETPFKTEETASEEDSLTNQNKANTDEPLTDQNGAPITEQATSTSTDKAINTEQTSETNENISENNDQATSIDNTVPGNVSTAPTSISTNGSSSEGISANNDGLDGSREAPINFNGAPAMRQASSTPANETTLDEQKISPVEEIIDDEDLLLSLNNGTSESNT